MNHSLELRVNIPDVSCLHSVLMTLKMPSIWFQTGLETNKLQIDAARPQLIPVLVNAVTKKKISIRFQLGRSIPLLENQNRTCRHLKKIHIPATKACEIVCVPTAKQTTSSNTKNQEYGRTSPEPKKGNTAVFLLSHSSICRKRRRRVFTPCIAWYVMRSSEENCLQLAVSKVQDSHNVQPR